MGCRKGDGRGRVSNNDKQSRAAIGRELMHRRYSDRRWKVQVKKICRKLGRYTYADVNRELRKLARPVKRQHEGSSKDTIRRGNVGCYLPTDRQLQAFLSRAPWSIEIIKGDKHRLAGYKFEDIKDPEGPAPDLTAR